MKKTSFLLACMFFFPWICVSGETFRSEILKSTIHFEIKGNKLIRTDSVLLQVNERMGDHDAEFGFAYSKGDKVDVLYAQIEDVSGNVIRKLKKDEVNNQSYISEISFYEDDFIKTFDMKHNTYPYRISYAVKTTQSKFFQIYALNLIHQRKPVKDASIIVDTSLDRPIKYKVKNMPEPQVIDQGGIQRYRWQYNYTPLRQAEINADYENTNIPQIKILPLTFEYGKKGEWESWATFGNWIYRLNAGRDILPESERIKIDHLLQGITAEGEKVRAIYRYLQDNVRYINVKIDIGGFQAYPADYVCKNRYGDCKALTNYMQALLKHAGIKSYYTLIYADDKVNDVDSDFAFQAFNHVILTVPLGNDTFFLECTSKNMPFGYLHTNIQGRKALLVDENDSRLISLPSLLPDDVLCSRKMSVKGNRLWLETVQRGESFEASLFLSSGVNKNILEKYLRDDILPSGSYSILEYDIDKTGVDSAQIHLSTLLEINNVFKQYGNNLILLPFPIVLPNYESPDKRVSDLQMDYPLFCEDTIIYTIPEGEIAKVPEAIRLNTDFGHYYLEFSIGDNALVVRKSLLINRGKHHQEDSYKDFYDFVMRIKSYENKNVYIEVL